MGDPLSPLCVFILYFMIVPFLASIEGFSSTLNSIAFPDTFGIIISAPLILVMIPMPMYFDF